MPGEWTTDMMPLKQYIKRLFPLSIYTWQKGRHVKWSSLRRLTPISRVFGLDRGQPICRYYIEAFLQRHSSDIHGRVLEVGVTADNPQATLVGDLATGQNIPREAFDCMILTQTFLFIYDMKAAVRNTYYALKPGGVLLATFPGISQISRYDMDRWGDYWRFTDASARHLFGDVFGAENITIETHGNVLVSCAYLHGLSVQELKQHELDYNDPDYQLLITVRAVRKSI
jgi:hypothetical protein